MDTTSGEFDVTSMTAGAIRDDLESVADDATADHYDLGRSYAGNAAEQDTTPTLGPFQCRCAGLNRQPARYL